MAPSLVVFLWLAVLLAACGEDGPSASPRGSASRPESGPAGSSRLTGPLTVFVAASLTEAFDDLKVTMADASPGLRLTYSVGGSQALAQQILQGAPADVFASADDANMNKLVDAGLVDAPRPFTRNRLEIAVAAGNPKRVTGLADLARPGLVVVLADPSVPVGAYSRDALAKALVVVRPRSLELDVKAALAKVTSGEADAAIVYATDVRAAGARVRGVEIPAAFNVAATYPIAVLTASRNRAAAVTFVDEVVAGAGQRALLARGFAAP